MALALMIKVTQGTHMYYIQCSSPETYEEKLFKKKPQKDREQTLFFPPIRGTHLNIAQSVPGK